MGNMQKLATYVASNPWFVILAMVVAVISLALMVVFYFKGRRVVAVRYAVRGTNLFQNFASKIPDLQVLYGGEQVADVTATKVVLWNGGSETISRDDVASAEPILIRAEEGCRILDAEVIGIKNKANLFSVSAPEDGTVVRVSFDYMDRLEGAVIQILHTGTSSAGISISGKVKGAGPLARALVRAHSPLAWFAPVLPGRFLKKVPAGMATWLFSLVMFGGPIVYLCAVMCIPRAPQPCPPPPAWPLQILAGAICVMYWSSGWRILRRRLPPGFEAFSEEL